ncbi:hypothetical protein CHLRE_06g294050v5 [Chlamydomonas reinhardtii]|uniref:SMCHD1 ribosomal S5 domain-containing protein n=1 Tax=Chlamydomonas reinhardtii TaxID=3055 RepID=A0A2K3DQG4_CHLRE|nr:uncharacterized protein CHLRE_06g294050v5 [Chlamydomonas reinhardtii]PNW82785.1 hypothetical protein CHLRE_06g294050v5 [Chlamydomonas reinhardtii]
MSLSTSDYITVLLKDGLGGRRQARVNLPVSSFSVLQDEIRRAFQPELDQQEFYLVTNNKVVNSDAVLRRLRPGGQVGVCLGAAPPRPSLSAAPPASSLPSGAGTAAGAGSAVRSRPPAGPSRPATSTAAGPAAPHGTSERKTEASSPTGSLDYRPPAKERISFIPHPKTLTMAGDYEYFSARGHHPFAFALAELVDNALRATKGQAQQHQKQQDADAAAAGGCAAGDEPAAATGVAAEESRGQAAAAPRSRDITISLVVNERSSAGLIRVQDNGRGMSPKELSDWAVMNLSMEDRGLLPSGAQHGVTTAGGSRYLSGDLSFFGVGSKNAAFFMGRSVKLATRTAGSEAVHELLIAGAELERRYKAGEAVYEEDMVHRQPGDESTLSQQEAAFGVTRSWIAEEVPPAASADGAAGAASPSSSAPGPSSGFPSFTRVTITDLRPDVLALMANADSGAAVCRDLAHLYHYYLHGPAGNVDAARAAPGKDGGLAGKDAAAAGAAGASGGGVGGGSAGSGGQRELPGGEAMPHIVVEYMVGGRCVWRRPLVEVDDDLETRYVRAAQARLEFSLDVPGKGAVEGVLWYFPFVNGAETVPTEQGAAAYGSGCPGGSGGGAGGGKPGGGAPGPGVLTLAHELPTQMTLHGAAALATQMVRAGRGGLGLGLGTQAGQLPEQMQRALLDLLDCEDGADAGGDGEARSTAPLFETFWQGRLIPGSGLDSVPFIEAVRAKLRGSASGKDYVPDEVFRRIRGALFFGPAWRVTRNKLTFRDPLQQLLAAATPGDRGLDRRLREWLRDCHTRLDRIIRFEGPADVELKALVRKELGEAMTGFKCANDGSRIIVAGDVVRLATKPAALGRVKYFAVPQAGAAEGVYATGFVTFAGVPDFVHGNDHTSTLPLRRIEEVLTPAAVEEFVTRERAKLPSAIKLEPLRLASGRRLDMAVGEPVPETTVAICNAAGQRLTRTFLQGQKVSLRVQQRLVYLGPRRPSAYCAGGEGDAAAAADGEGNADMPQGDTVIAGSGAAPSAAAPAAAEPAATEAGGKRGRKRRKKKGAEEDDDEAAVQAAHGAADAEGGKENHAPSAPGAKRPRRGAAASAVVAAAAAAAANPAPAQPSSQPLAAATAPAATEGGSGGVSSGARGRPLADGVGEVVLCVENKTPVDGSFQFSKIAGGLTRAGTFFLEYRLLPDLPPGCATDAAGAASAEPTPLWCRSVIYATAGPAVRFELRGEARAVLATKALALGEALPPLQITCYDAQDNEVSPADAAAVLGSVSAASVELMRRSGAGEEQAAASQTAINELKLEWQAASTPEAVVLQGLRVVGCSSAVGCNGGMRAFGGTGHGTGANSSLQSADQARGSPGSDQRGTGAQGSGVGGVENGSDTNGTKELDLQLRVTLPNMPAQTLPIKLRPGAPAALRLLPGHPFAPAGTGIGSMTTQLLPAAVMHGEALPEFQVAVLDAWGNATCPTPDLPTHLELEGPVLAPACSRLDVDSSGRATVQGVRVVAPGADYIGAQQDVRLSIRCSPRGCGARAALEAAEAAAAAAVSEGAGPLAGCGRGWGSLVLPLVVQPCTQPTRLELLLDGEPLPVGPGSAGDGHVALMEGVAAGSRVTSLALRFLDEAGRPAESGFKGKLQVSWAKGSKKVTVSDPDAVQPLQPLHVKEQAGGEPQSAWVRFVGDGALSGLTLEASLELAVVAGAPAAWGISVLEWSGAANGGGDGVEGGRGGHSQATENLGCVACGAPICLEIQPHDAHSNRCTTWTGSAPRPTPVVEPVREGEDASEATLLYDAADWVCGWELSQHSGCEAYHVRLTLGGTAGPVKLLVRDSSGPGGESLLLPDALPVELQPGRPTSLAFDGPQQLRCGARGTLGDLSVRVTDDWGNLVEGLAAAGGGRGGGKGGKGGDAGSALELTLQTSAIAADGSGNAAKVSVAGSNKAKVIKGCAVFRDVRLDGAPGTSYLLRVGSASRKVALRDTSLPVEVVAQNIVRHVALAPCSLPQEPLEPGLPLELQVQVTTEDGAALPPDIATAGLSLRIKAPSAEAAAAARGEEGAAAAMAAAGEGRGGSSAAACTLVLQPQPQEEGCSPASAGLWRFVTPGALLVAGEYTVTAEYVELRGELARALPKADQTVRSVSHALQLLPAAPITATLEQPAAAVAASASLAVTNAGGSGRVLLSGAAVQLRDEYGNAVQLDGVLVRWVLDWPSPGDGEDGEAAAAAERDAALAAGAELPSLQGGSADAPQRLEVVTDGRGRAFVRELALEPGSGRVGAAPEGTDGPQALHLELRLEVALRADGGGPTAGDAEAEADGEEAGGAWLRCWSAAVVFSDDAARAATLQRLGARRDELMALVAEAEAAKEEADRAVTSAKHAAAQAQQGVERARSRAQGHGQGAHAAAGSVRSASEARELMHSLAEQQRRAEEAARQRGDAISARYGGSGSGLVQALNRCLAAQEGAGEVVGVLAQLATVDEPRVSALLAAAFSSTLQILVVRSYDCIKRLRGMLSAARCQVPSMLALGMAQAFTGEGGSRHLAEVISSMRGVGDKAVALQAAACAGADPPLIMALPHTRALVSMPADRAQSVVASGAGPAADEWPEGCLGYAVNLLRPAVPGHRAALFYSQLGRTLLFETLDQAAAYRAYVLQSLGTAMGDVYTLDGGKLSGRGVVVGSGFRVLPLEEAPVRFGAGQGQQAALAKQLADKVVEVEALAVALDAAEAAAGASGEAEVAAETAAAQLAGVTVEVAVELQHIESEITRLAGRQQQAADGGGGRRAGRSNKRRREGAATQGRRERERDVDAEVEEGAEAPPQPSTGEAEDNGNVGVGGGKRQRGRRNQC